jgi:ferredoxin-like protein FixX
MTTFLNDGLARNFLAGSWVEGDKGASIAVEDNRFDRRSFARSVCGRWKLDLADRCQPCPPHHARGLCPVTCYAPIDTEEDAMANCIEFGVVAKKGLRRSTTMFAPKTSPFR